MYRVQIQSEYSDKYNDESNLVDKMNKVSSTIKPLSKDNLKDSVAELEKDEYLFSPEKLTLHKVLGKKHTKGGTPVNIAPNSFIFSDFKDLAITKNEKELYEFKNGGTNKAKNNTPAKVLSKQLDIEHHNKMVNILNSKNQDDIAKNSANLMLQKNMEKVGQLAYLQENKKGFPQGIPDFAQNVAPVYDDNTNTQITQSTQYMKHGGYILPEFKGGGNVRSKAYSPNTMEFLNNGRAFNMYGTTTNTDIDSPQHWTGSSYSGVDQNKLKDFQSWFFQNNPKASILDFQKAYNVEFKKQTGEDYFSDSDENRANDFDGLNGLRTSAALMFNAFRTTTQPGQQVRIPGTPGDSFQLPQVSKDPNFPIRYVDMYKPEPTKALDYTMPKEQSFTDSQVFGLPDKGLVPGEAKAQTESYTPARVGLTNWQQFNIAAPLLQSLGVRTQLPYRQQLNPIAPGVEYTNSDAQLASIDQSFNTNRRSLNNMSPTQALQANASAYGQGLDARNQAIAQTNQQNQQIGSQYNQNVANLYNQTQSQNSNFNKQYYDEVQTALKNKQDYKDFFKNKSLSTANEYLSENQTLNNTFNAMNAGFTKDGQTPYNLVNNGVGYDVRFNNNWKGDVLSLNTGTNNQTNSKAISDTLLKIINNPNSTDKDKIMATEGLNKLNGKKLGGYIKTPKINYRNFNVSY